MQFKQKFGIKSNSDAQTHQNRVSAANKARPSFGTGTSRPAEYTGGIATTPSVRKTKRLH